MAPKMGRPHKEKTKNVNIGFRLSEETAKKLQECADILEVSRTQVVEKGIDLVYEAAKEK